MTVAVEVDVEVGVTVVEVLAVVVVVELLDVEALLFIAVELDGALNLAEVFEIVEILLIFDLVDDNFSNVTNFVEEEICVVVLDFNVDFMVVNNNTVVSVFFTGSALLLRSSSGQLAKEAHNIMPKTPKHKMLTRNPIFILLCDEFDLLLKTDFFVESPKILKKRKYNTYSYCQFSKLHI